MSQLDRERSALLEEFRKSTLERTEQISLIWIALEGNPDDANASVDLQRKLHSLKGEAKMMGFATISRIAHRAEDLVAAAKAHGFRVSNQVGDALLAAVDLVSLLSERRPDDEELTPQITEILNRIDDLVRGVKNGTVRPAAQQIPVDMPAINTSAPKEDAAPRGDPVAPPTEGLLRVDPALMMSFSDSVQDMMVKHSQYEHIASMFRQIDRELQAALGMVKTSEFQALQSLGDESPEPQQTESVARRLEVFHSIQLRLSYLQSHLDQLLFDGSAQIKELAYQAQKLRLVPLNDLFSRYVRVVRDLSREHGKQASCQITGEAVTLDKNIVDKLADPLMHLVSNAIDHGLESATERRSKGKPEEGKIIFSADSRCGNVVVIEVIDDGRGIDEQAVVARAIDRGLVSREEASGLTRAKIIELLFRPGFTTRTETTEISGRGIGLDVVKKHVEMLGGTVRMVSEKDQGTRLTLTIPSRAFLSGILILELGQEFYGLPNGSVEAVVTVEEQDLLLVHDQIHFRFREELVPLTTLSALIGSSHEAPDESRVVIIRDADMLVGLKISNWLVTHEVIIRPLGELYAQARAVLGACTLPKGELVLVLNPAELVSRFTMGDPRYASRQPRSSLQPALAEAPRHRILVVEDSAITRIMISRILSAHNYRIEEAADGVDALEKLAHASYDLLMTDLDMPRMNGIELIRRVREQQALLHLPIVVLTTHGTAEDKEAALLAGADGYLVKSEFSEERLHAMVTQHLGDS